MDGEAMATLLQDLRGEWTPADLDLMPEHWKVELLDGTLIVNAKPIALHQLIAFRLAQRLEESVGDTFTLLLDITLDLSTAQFAPDITVAHRSRVDWTANAQPPEVAAMVVEIASRSTEAIDRTIKAERYAAAGIPLYLRVVPQPATMLAFRLAGDAYTAVGSWGAGETVRIEEFPDLSFDPGDLLR